MKITDFVKPSMMTKSNIAAAESLLAPKELVLNAFTANCRTTHGSSNRIIVLTNLRLLFVAGIVKPPQHDAFPLGSCIGIGDISGGLVKKQDYVYGDTRITIEATKEQLQQLTEKTLAAIEAYQNQPAGVFQPPPTANPTATPATQKVTAASAKAASTPVSAPITRKGQAKQRIAENKAAGVACCPKCGSTSLSANKKGFGVGKALAGAFITSTPVGLVGGALGANKLVVTCLNCGHKFSPGKK